MPRCRAAMTKLPSSEPAVLPPLSSRSTFEVSLNASVTLYPTISEGWAPACRSPRCRNRCFASPASGGARTQRRFCLPRRDRRTERHLGDEHVAAAEFGLDQVLH